MKKIKNKEGYLIMFLHSCAHFLHASAHCLHTSILSPIFSHSIAHASHMSAHMYTCAFRIRFPCTSSWMPSCTCLRSPCTSSCTFPSFQPFGCLRLSCIRYNRPHRPSCIRCSFRCSQSIAGFLTWK